MTAVRRFKKTVVIRNHVCPGVILYQPIKGFLNFQEQHSQETFCSLQGTEPVGIGYWEVCAGHGN